MSIAAAVSVNSLKGAKTTYEIYLGKKRLGYVGLARPNNPNPISWLSSHVGGLELKTEERIAIVERVRELMAAEWEKHDAEQKRLRDLENGVVTDVDKEAARLASLTGDAPDAATDNQTGEESGESEDTVGDDPGDQPQPE